MSTEKTFDTSWMDGADDVDQSTVEQGGARYPFAQWVNGDQKMKKVGDVSFTGGWFMQEKQAGAFDMAGWVKGELTFENGTGSAGYFLRDLTVAVIRYRRAWMTEDKARFPWKEFRNAKDANGGKNPRGKLQALALVKGWQSPIMLTMNGMAGAAFTGSKDASGVLKEFDEKVIQEANILNLKRGNPNKFPLRAFWLTVGPARDGSGPKFTEVGKNGATSFVTLPAAIGLKDKPTAEDIGKLAVGRDVLAATNLMYANAEAWAHAWDAMSLQEELPGMPTVNLDEAPF